MKILVILGSPKEKGNTNNIVKIVEQQFKCFDEFVEFEYLVLKNINFQLCKGCYQCLEKGENHCPLKDDREEVEAKMANSDGVIFACPVYVYNVPWIMKNFIDRFAYASHRPRFNGKKSMVICTTGAVGLKYTLFTMAFQVGTWGFKVTQKLGIVCHPGHISEKGKQKLERKTQKDIINKSKAFYKSVKNTNPSKPGLLDLIAFRLQKFAFSRSDKSLADYNYWINKGWFDKKTTYYYPVKTNIIKKVLSNIISSISIGYQKTK